MKKKLGLSFLSFVAGSILAIGLPTIAHADTSDGTYAGGVFVTGHDPDFHAHLGDANQVNGARNVIRKAIGYVTNNKTNPKILLVTDVFYPGGGHSDSRLGMDDSGYKGKYDVADYGSRTPGILDLHTVDFKNYDVIIVASDFGGWLRQRELDILNARSSEIIDYINNGGGVVAFAESDTLTNKNLFGFLPFLVSGKALDQLETGSKVTDVGKAMGLTDYDVNSNASHCIFTGTGGMEVVDRDGHGNILSLATKKGITPVGVDDKPVVTATTDHVPNANGWYKSDVTISFTATDTDSTPVVRTDAPIVVSTEGAGQVIKGTATDSANLTGTTSVTINLDKTAPATTATLAGAAGTKEETYTSAVNVTLAGSDALSGVATTEYRVNGGAWQPYTTPLSFTDLGTYTVDYRSVDKADNEEAIESTTFSIVPFDQTPPVTTATVAPVSGDNSGANLFNTDVAVTLTATDDLSGVEKTEYRINDGEWQTYDGAIPVTGEGNYFIEYRSTDKAGNVEATQSVTFTVDKTPPVTEVDLPQPNGSNGWYNTVVTIPMNCTDLSGVSKTEYRINGGEWVTYTTPLTLSDGKYTIDYRSTDKAGNVEETKTVDVNVDTTPPVITATVPAPNDSGWYTTNVPISFGGTDNLSGVSTIQYRINGGEWHTYTGSFTAIHDGICTIEYRGTDDSGNTSDPVPIVLKIDKEPPTLNIKLDNTVLWPPNHKMVPIHVTIDANDDMSGLANVELVSITSNEPDEGLGDGDTVNDIQGADIGTADTLFYVRAERSGLGTGRIYTVTYKATDKAGNVTYATATITVPHDQSKK